jgi:aminoglycoside 6'-N-acetyltransferase
MITLRPATLNDVPLLDLWDLEPHVISATSGDPDAKNAFGDTYWADELTLVREDEPYFIAELDGRPIGAMQVIDPQTERARYWGDAEPGPRAIDIWIGDAAGHGQGYGAEMMRLAIEACFQAPEVTAILIDPLASNTRAHTFYQRLGFLPEGIRELGEDNDICLVHRLTREAWRKPHSGE